MKQLLGEYACKIDAKGRLRLPSSLMAHFEPDESRTFVVNRGFEKCLTMYPEKVWDKITVEINELNQYDEKSRKFRRYFYRGATRVTPDSADRLNLPNSLLEWAGIKGEVVLSAVNDLIEIWAKDRWDAALEEEPEDFSALAQSVLGNKKSEAE
ncbi:MAG: division/cell wall cluster transcriptional repressor MraZ [Bacteroidetes bacterium]|nr:MAG: division/cell wall cluster transcriptional repressor MraZ [Bacteroidota bacterium]